jgi:hypothetical protein
LNEDDDPSNRIQASVIASGIAQGFPPSTDKRVTLANWDSPPFNRWAFQHVREIMPTVEVRRGSGHAARLETDLQDLDNLAVAPYEPPKTTSPLSCALNNSGLGPPGTNGTRP